jgi:hypothetical protein
MEGGNMKKVALPQSIQDAINPGTRLLEKRRIMYDVQEAFEREKKKYNELV